MAINESLRLRVNPALPTEVASVARELYRKQRTQTRRKLAAERRKTILQYPSITNQDRLREIQEEVDQLVHAYGGAENIPPTYLQTLKASWEALIK